MADFITLTALAIVAVSPLSSDSGSQDAAP